VDPADALASLLLAAGVGRQHIPPGLGPRGELWHHYLAGKRILLLLDDAAGDEQLRPLLPGTEGSLVIVTSRSSLALSAISLVGLPPEASAELLVRLAGRPALKAGDAAVGEITRLCGHLPLAVAMLATTLHQHPALSATRLARELAAAPDAFHVAYHNLTTAQRQMVQHLNLHLGTEIDAGAASALAGTSQSQTQRLLEAIRDHHLLAEPVQGRYQIRAQARACGEALPSDQREGAIGRLLDYYLHAVVAASRHFDGLPSSDPPHSFPDLPAYQDAVLWMSAERINVHNAARYAAEHGMTEYAVAIAAAMHGFLRTEGHWDQAAALHSMVLAAVHDGADPRTEASARAHLGDAQYLTAAHREATANLTRALDLYTDAGDGLGQASVLSGLGAILQAAEDFPAALARQERAFKLYRDHGHSLGQAITLNQMGRLRSATRDYEAAAACQEQALALHRALGRPLSQAQVLNSLGELSLAIAAPAQAQDRYEQALAIGISIGALDQQARALEGIGRCHLKQDQPEEGAAVLRKAMAMYRQIASPSAERIQRTLTATAFFNS
jgi:tetratricopeptide (TPR) repeat protein